jgi:hypothetical protein
VDWLADLSRSTDVRPIQTALEAATRLGPASYLEAPETSAAVARRAVARVQAASELRDLWDESEDAGAAWRQQLSDLVTRLAG